MRFLPFKLLLCAVLCLYGIFSLYAPPRPGVLQQGFRQMRPRAPLATPVPSAHLVRPPAQFPVPRLPGLCLRSLGLPFQSLSVPSVRALPAPWTRWGNSLSEVLHQQLRFWTSGKDSDEGDDALSPPQEIREAFASLNIRNWPPEVRHAYRKEMDERKEFSLMLAVERAEGLKEGKAEGLKEGLKEGEKKGKEEEKLRIALTLTNQGVDPSIIEASTGLSMEEQLALWAKSRKMILI